MEISFPNGFWTIQPDDDPLKDISGTPARINLGIFGSGYLATINVEDAKIELGTDYNQQILTEGQTATSGEIK